MKKFFRYLLIILAFLLIVYFSYHFIFIRLLNKYTFEKNSIEFYQKAQNSPFSISKIIEYSSASAENQNTTFSQPNWILNILQYTDIAIYINYSGTELEAKNSVKKLSLDNITLSTPKIGSSSLYYLNSLNFGTANIDNIYKLEKSLEFTVLNDENKDNSIQANTPVFFTDCSNPITLKYVNNPVLENYTVTSNKPIFFDGKLLQMANIDLKNLETTIKFTIKIQSNDNKNYYYNLSIPICLATNNSNIYDGSILLENEYENYKFIEIFE